MRLGKVLSENSVRFLNREQFSLSDLPEFNLAVGGHTCTDGTDIVTFAFEALRVSICFSFSVRICVARGHLRERSEQINL